MDFIFDNERPIYIQLIEQLEVNIVSGKLKAGERLLSVRDLAVMSKVNPNTMQKALADLESRGLIYTERTNGKFITKDEELLKNCREKYAREKVRRFFSDMEELGLTSGEIEFYVKQMRGEE